MKLPALLVADTHLTADPRHEYRWGLFPWLARQCMKWEVQTLGLLGDLSDAKDYHPAILVNRTVRALTLLRDCVPCIKVLKGNHDYLTDGNAFFEFLSALPGVQFINTPYDSSAEGEPCLWLPHTRNPVQDWAGLDLSHYRTVFMHQTIKGALSSNGTAMEGEALPDLSAAGKIWSGDIHVPQVIGPVEYVGSPYHVHLGDNFKPRCVLLDTDGRTYDLRFRTVSRVRLDVHSAQALREQGTRPGDHAKIRVHLTRAEAHEWQTVRRQVQEEAAALGLEVQGIELVLPKSRQRVTDLELQAAPAMSAEQAVLDYVQGQGLGGDMLDVGLDLI